MGKWRKFIGRAAAFLARNVSIVISTLSFGVAALSLYFSISTQQLDRVYKEVSILPRLGIKLDVENFSISLDNSGLGPAVIHRVRFAIAGKCYDSDNSRAISRSFVNLRKVSLPTAFTKIRSRIATRITSHWSCRLLHTPSVKALPAGDSFPYVTVDPRAVRDIFAFERVEVIAIKQQFADAVIKVPLSILYCSLTELFCDLAAPKTICAIYVLTLKHDRGRWPFTPLFCVSVLQIDVQVPLNST